MNVFGIGVSVIVMMNFSGYLRFLVYINFEILICFVGWICSGGCVKVDRNILFFIIFIWGCILSKFGEF